MHDYRGDVLHEPSPILPVGLDPGSAIVALGLARFPLFRFSVGRFLGDENLCHNTTYPSRAVANRVPLLRACYGSLLKPSSNGGKA